MLGSAGSHGGFGHVTLTTRVNFLKASLPNLASAARAEAGWKVVLFDLAAGRSVDHYGSTAHIRAHTHPAGPPGTQTVTLDLGNAREV